MRFRFLIPALLVLVIAVNAVAVTNINPIDKYYPDGLKRLYLFHINEKQVGTLEIKFDGSAKFENQKAYRFTEKLKLDYAPLGQPYNLEIENRHYVDIDGFYIGDDMKLVFDRQSQELYLHKTDDSLLGYYVANKQRQDVAQAMPGSFFSFENNMLDQYELFLAARDISLGDTITDNIILPQTMMTMPVRLVVEDYQFVKYGEVYDSAYVCHFLQPSNQLAYITRDNKLIRVDLPAQDMTIMLSESPLEKMAPKKQAFGFSDFIKRLPIYLVYLILGIIFVSAFIWRYHKSPLVYISFVLGGAVFTVVGLTQIPLQKWYSLNYLIPHVQAGDSLYFYGIIIPLISGLIQETLKLIPIALLCLWRSPKQMYAVAVGVFCGLGFGLYEAGSLTGAAYQSGAVAIFSWPVFESIFAIIFHITGGAAMGYGLNRGFKHTVGIWLMLVLVHSFSSYLIVFRQTGAIDIGIFGLLTALIDLILLLGVYFMIKNARR